MVDRTFVLPELAYIPTVDSPEAVLEGPLNYSISAILANSMVSVPPRDYTHVWRSGLKQALSNYQCATPFQEMVHILHSTANIPELRSLLTDLKAIAVDSVEGNILMGGLQHIDELLVIKYNKPKSHPRSILHEYFVGARLNELRNRVPNFVYTYGFVICPSKPEIQRGDAVKICTGPSESGHLLLEYVSGKTLGSIVQILTMNELGKILLAVFSALEIANHEQGFCHYDLHAENIMIRMETKPITLRYTLSDGTEVQVNTRYVPVIIDYGFARSQVGNILYARPKPLKIVPSENKSFAEENHPFLDWYKLFTHLTNIMSRDMKNKYNYDKETFFRLWLDALRSKISADDTRELDSSVGFFYTNIDQIARRYYYPQKKEVGEMTFLDIVQPLLKFRDTHTLSIPYCSEAKLLAQIYRDTSQIPCGDDSDLSKDRNGRPQSVFSCSQSYSSGKYIVLKFERGMAFYTGDQDQVINNREYPLQNDYYKPNQNALNDKQKQRLRVWQTRNEQDKIRDLLSRVRPWGTAVYTTLPESQITYPSDIYKCGKYCVSAYRVTKPFDVVQLANHYNIQMLLADAQCPLTVKLLLLVTHGWEIKYGDNFVDYDNVGEMLNILNPQNDEYSGAAALISTNAFNMVKKLGQSADEFYSAVQDNIKNAEFRSRNYFETYLIPYLEGQGFAGFCYSYGTEGSLYLGPSGRYLLERDLDSPHDWQHNSEQYFFRTVGKLVKDLKKYKTTAIDDNAGDLWAHTVWVCLRLQWMSEIKHPAMAGVDIQLARIAAVLHDVGKGGDLVYLSYDKPNHAELGSRYLSEGYVTEDGALDLNEVIFDMGGNQGQIPLIQFLIHYHDFLSPFMSGGQNVTTMLPQVYREFTSAFRRYIPNAPPQVQYNAFATMYALWTADIMSSLPYPTSKEYLSRLSVGLLQGANVPHTLNSYISNFPFISNLPQSHHGRDTYRDWRVDDYDQNGIYLHTGKGLLLREKMLYYLIHADKVAEIVGSDNDSDNDSEDGSI